MHAIASCDIPMSLISKITTILRNFFWGTHKGGKLKFPWISWNRICNPTSKGGLGVISMKDFFWAFKMKQAWNFQTNKSTFPEFTKHMIGSFEENGDGKSKRWKILQKAWNFCIPAKACTVGDENVSF